MGISKLFLFSIKTENDGLLKGVVGLLIGLLSLLGLATLGLFSLGCTNKLFVNRSPEPSQLVTPIDIEVQTSEDSATQLKKIITDIANPYIDRNIISKDKVPGMVISFVSPKGVGVVGIGTSELGMMRSLSGETPLGIGSVSKLFTGLMLAKNVIDGRLQLSQEIAPLAPTKLKGYLDQGITLKDLVTHYAGYQNMPGNLNAFRDLNLDGKNDALAWSPAKNYNMQLLTDCFSSGQCAPTTKPGVDYLYSNLGIGILGLLLTNSLGYSNYSALLSSQITNPLGLNATVLSDNQTDLQRVIGTQIVYNYDSNGVGHGFAEMGVLNGAGGIVTTGNDMVQFLRALTHINKSSLDSGIFEMTRKLNVFEHGDIGYAVEISDLSARFSSQCGTTLGSYKVYIKPGSTPVNTAFLIWHQESSTGVFVAVNKGGFEAVSCLAANMMNELIKF